MTLACFHIKVSDWFPCKSDGYSILIGVGGFLNGLAEALLAQYSFITVVLIILLKDCLQKKCGGSQV